MRISFLLNGETCEIDTPPTATLLDWLRARGLTGTKEGCNEGDCGACTVMLTGPDGQARAANACILFLPQLHGRAVRTIEGISAQDLHPVQQALIDEHASQCGFCTPGIAVSLAVAHLNGQRDHADRLAGNLCRCTGYGPILRAAELAAPAPVPAQMRADAAGVARILPGADPALPETADALADWCLAHPEGRIIAGGSDVVLWVTKGLRDPDPVVFLHRCADLARIETGPEAIRVGAAVTVAAFREAIAPHHPALAEMLRRFGSAQVRTAATVGGNLANGSPIGDLAPALIALGARLHLRRGDARRSIPLESFFLAYGQQDRAPGEFVEAVTIPRHPAPLRVWKVSKRFDQDISALCGAFYLEIGAGRVQQVRIAFGGMAGIPARAPQTEAALHGAPWEAATIARAARALGADYTPLSDARGSAAYRLAAAEGLLWRLWHDHQGTALSVHDPALRQVAQAPGGLA